MFEEKDEPTSVPGHLVWVWLLFVVFALGAILLPLCS
ncbi:hypothetical protein UFOVP1040_42 [uncultured Caudovirales phage]|uniref:Uncharacterized protein n=1 Tax=uncultured Caudovirales phage TaxID=2100421 RepID=A0A6J5QKY9_9CAUD|nr:hypothetical protein UFOVP1040_42 [uncultured Caudovirales phage]